MKLAQPFVKLPLRFDVKRLAQEVSALPPESWARHPQAFAGNTAARLISVDGGENDEVIGRMEMTPHLQSCPYIQQILARFGVVWGRSRLMRLAPGACVPEHSDTNYHWFSRVRVHIPVITRPGVSFHCDDQVVHMAAGEAWIFDNWRLHRVQNDTSEERIHLVADTSGSAAFWNMVLAGQQDQPPEWVGYQPRSTPSLALERFNSYRVMPPSEVEHLLGDLGADLQVNPARQGTLADVSRFQNLLRSFCADWRQLWLLHGDSEAGLEQFHRLSQALLEVIQPFGDKLCMRSNRLPAMRVLDARVVRYLVNDEVAALMRPQTRPAAKPGGTDAPKSVATAASPGSPPRRSRIAQPVFIVAAPRSGSTLLFETLACTPQFWTVGGEAHWLAEGFDHLAPGAPGINDNRLDARHASPELSVEMERRLAARLQGPRGGPPPADAGQLRVLEKTPKNALRIPFFAEIFPDARFVFLWRDPRENINSIIEAWKSGGWITYSEMPDWDGPWSMLLPPGWPAMRGKSLGEIAAFQWEATNRIVLDDLSALPRSQWMALNYADFLADTTHAVERICQFAGIDMDEALGERAASPLPPSRHTLTKPAPDKWRKNAALIEPCLNGVQSTWDRLAALHVNLPATGASGRPSES